MNAVETDYLEQLYSRCQVNDNNRVRLIRMRRQAVAEHLAAAGGGSSSSDSAPREVKSDSASQGLLHSPNNSNSPLFVSSAGGGAGAAQQTSILSLTTEAANTLASQLKAARETNSAGAAASSSLSSASSGGVGANGSQHPLSLTAQSAAESTSLLGGRGSVGSAADEKRGSSAGMSDHSFFDLGRVAHLGRLTGQRAAVFAAC